MTTPLDAALSYAARGWRVIPIAPGRKHPPIDAWQEVATTDEPLIRDWYARWPTYGVGIATGAASNLFVLDVDVANGKFGDEVLADLEHEHGRLPDTVEVVTGTGGRHIYFQPPDGVEIRNEAGRSLGPGLDIRGDGGQVLAPPTVHPNGRRYEWEASSHPDDVAVAEAPDWLVELLTATPDPTQVRRERSIEVDADTPGNRFARSVSWPELLEADGATYLGTRTHRRSGTTYEVWARPGVGHTSATLYYQGSDVLKVFTPNWGGIDAATGEIWQLAEGETYTKFGYYTARHHGGDFARAAAELARAGRDDLDAWIVETVTAARTVPLPASDDDADDQDDEWPDPIPLGQLSAAPFPLDALPDWMADECAALADEMQVPVDLCAQVALGAWSAACAGKAKIVVAGRWTEHLNLFLATAMPSGAGKSPVSKRLTAPLRELEAELVELTRKQVAEAKAERKVAEHALRDAEKSGDAGRIRDAHLALDGLEVPFTPRLLVDDVTPEMLALLLHRHEGRMALISTEATIFDIACGLYSSGKRTNNNVFLQGWSADTLIVDRKGSTVGDGTEIRVAEPILTVAICVQPSTIAELRKHPELAGRGFTARFMYSIPESLVGKRDRWKVLEQADEQAARRYHDTFVGYARRYASWQMPITLRTTDEAARRFVAWTHDMEPLLRPEGDYEPISEWTAKLHASVGRLAGLLHLADGGDHNQPVDVTTMERAIAVGEYWVSHALTIAEMWADDAVGDIARRIVADRFATGDVTEFGAGDLRQRWHRRRIETLTEERGDLDTSDVVMAVLNRLVEHGYIRPVGGGPVLRPSHGRAAQRFAVNPRARVTRVNRPMCNPPDDARYARSSKGVTLSSTSSSSLLSRNPERARNARQPAHDAPEPGESSTTPQSPQPTGWLIAALENDEDGAA